MRAESPENRRGPTKAHLLRTMVKAVLTALLLVAAGLPISAPVAAQEASAEYRLLPGDEITVKMPLNPELDTTGPIGPDGRFSIPLVGRVEIGGLTLGDAETAISRQLREGRIVADAKPGIVVVKYKGVIYVGGEVRNPGSVPLAQALNPLQAILSAGGLLDTARSRKVAIIRQASTATHKVETVNLRDIVKTGGGQAPIVLAPGDVVFVPKSTIAEVNLFVNQYINGLIPNRLNFQVNLNNGSSSSSSSSNTSSTSGTTVNP